MTKLVTKTDLTKLIKRVIKEETSINPSNSLAHDFVINVLKVGSKENVFDAYLAQNNVNPEELSTFMSAVIKELEKYAY